MTLPTATQARHALLIGIDAYPKLNPLDGCVNDVHLMRSVLQEQYGFRDEDITQLLDGEATREAILAAMDALVERVGTDDLVVIQYAGHGCQMTDREGDEPDGLDETIMPYDSEGWQGDNRDITDDEINLRLQALAKKTSYTTVIIDACHSGTVTRDGFGTKARTMPADRRPIDQLPPSPIPPEMREAMMGRGPSRWMPLADSHVLMAGCRDDEVSYEYAAPAGDDTVAHGALTYFLAEELRNAPEGATYRDVFERAAAKVNAANSRQHPQMEGRVDREVFGVRDRVPMRFTRVLAREGDAVTLAAGSAHGATVGSRYAVFPAGTKVESDATPVGMVEVTAVRVVDADARIVESTDDPALQAGARAVETTHVHDALRLVVELADRSGDAEASAAARATLEGSSLLEVVAEGSGSAAARVYLLSPREGAGDEDPVPQLGALTAATLAVVDGTGALLMPPRNASEHAVVRENLERVARYRQVLSLENPDSYSPMKGRFSIDLLRHGADGSWIVAEPEEAGGLVVYEEGDAIAFRVTSDHDAPVFMSLLDFGLTGGVSQVYPAPGTTEKLDGGVSFDIGTRPGTKPYTVAIPRELAAEFTEAVETLKLFATSGPADLSVLSQTGVRSAERRAPDSPLSALLRAASHGGVRDIAQPVGEDDWATALRPFVVRRRGGVDLNADGSTLNLGSVSLSTPGLAGRVTAQPGASGRAEAQAPTPAALVAALETSKMTVQDTVLVTAPTPPRAGSRGAGVEPSVEITARAPAPGYDQAVLATDELGVLSWHLPEPAAAGTRSGPGGRLTYRIPYGEKGRGMAASAALVALKVLVFPRWEAAVGAAAQSAVAKWEAHNRPYRVRWFGPTDHTQEEGRTVDAEGWKSLAAGRSLLFVHGTTSMAHSAFGDLPVDFMEDMSRRYEGRVFALDHPTVSEDPRDNVKWFLEQIPDGTHLDVDIVCHSRGGLVSRILAERLSEFPMGARRLDVGRVVFVGSPNAGTNLADGRYMGSFLDTYTNMVCRLPGSMVVQALQVVLAVVKQLAFSGAEAALVGLRSMVPGGEFNAWLNDGKDHPTARYHALASSYEPSEPGLVRLANATLLGKIFDGPHDLVVPVPSVVEANGASSFPIQDRVVFQGPDSMSHVSYFGNPAVQKQLSTWLEGESRPARAMAAAT